MLSCIPASSLQQPRTVAPVSSWLILLLQRLSNTDEQLASTALQAPENGAEGGREQAGPSRALGGPGLSSTSTSLTCSRECSKHGGQEHGRRLDAAELTLALEQQQAQQNVDETTGGASERAGSGAVRRMFQGLLHRKKDRGKRD